MAAAAWARAVGGGGHAGGVEGVADPQQPGRCPRAAELGGGADRGVVAGDDGGGRAVDGGDRGSGRQRARGDLVLGGGDGGHGAAGGLLLHQPGPGGDEARGVGQGEDAGEVGGGDLADGVPGAR